MKKLILLLILIYNVQSFALELWAKAGTSTNGTFIVTETEYETDPQPSAGLELVFNLSDAIDFGLETGIAYLMVNENEYVNYVPVGGRLTFNMPENEMDLGFYINGGYNVSLVRTTYLYQDIEEIVMGPYVGFGTTITSGLFQLDINYSFNYLDVTGEIVEDEEIYEGTEGTFASFLTLKIGYQLY